MGSRLAVWGTFLGKGFIREVANLVFWSGANLRKKALAVLIFHLLANTQAIGLIFD